jgi:putative transposase
MTLSVFSVPLLPNTQSPLAAWTSTLSEGTFGLRRPPDANKFYIDFLPGELCLVRRDGIRLFNIHYWHSVLSTVAGRSTQKYLMGSLQKTDC